MLPNLPDPFYDWDWLVEAGKEKEEWRYFTMASGEQFVMITGIWMMLALFVANWDFLIL